MESTMSVNWETRMKVVEMPRRDFATPERRKRLRMYQRPKFWKRLSLFLLAAAWVLVMYLAYKTGSGI
jgi:hypothetical protein